MIIEFMNQKSNERKKPSMEFDMRCDFRKHNRAENEEVKSPRHV